MRIIYPDFSLDCNLKQGEPFVFVIENPSIYTEIVSDLWNQNMGQNGILRLLDGEKEKSFAKDVCLIMNPLAVDCNERKILNKLFDGMTKTMNQSFLMENTRINSEIVNYLDKILDSEPFHLEMNVEMDFTGLLKLYNVHLEYEGSSLLEKLSDYIRLTHQICRIKLFIFVGLKAFLKEEELEEFYNLTQYEEVELLLIESTSHTLISNEAGLIIDIDQCVINIP